MKKIVLLLITTLFSLSLFGCKANDLKDDESELILEVGAEGNYEYKGKTFSYKVYKEGVQIIKVSPDEGEKLEFPEMIGGKKVFDVYSDCVYNYREIKFASIISKPIENEIVEKIEFYDNVDIGDGTLFRQMKNLKEVILPNGITTIKKGWFVQHKTIEKVVLPESCLNIEESAFIYCSALCDINLINVKQIGKSAFKNCSSLTKIELNNVEELGDSAFENCSSLCCDLSFDKLNIFYMGEGTFKGCKELAGKTVFFKEYQDSNSGHPEYGEDAIKLLGYLIGISSEYSDLGSPFSGIDVNIQSEGLDEAVSMLLKCIYSKPIVNTTKFDSYEDNIAYSSCDNGVPETLIELIKNYFNGKSIKKGETLKINEMSEILSMIDYDGNVTNLPPYELTASKYRFIEQFTLFLSSEELKKNIVNESNRICYEYNELDNNMEIINNNYNEVYFFVVEGEWLYDTPFGNEYLEKPVPTSEIYAIVIE